MAPASTSPSVMQNGIAITPTAKPVLSSATMRPKTGTGSKIQSRTVRRRLWQQPVNSTATSPLTPLDLGHSSTQLTNCSDAPERPPPISEAPAVAQNGSTATLSTPIDDSCQCGCDSL